MNCCKQKRFLKSIYIMIVVIFVLGTVVTVGGLDWLNPGADDDTVSDTDTTGDGASEYITVAENDVLAMKFSQAKGGIQIVQKDSQYVWSGPAAEKLTDDVVGDSTYLTSMMESSLMCTYFQKSAMDASYNTLYSGECTEIKSETKNGGVDLTYIFGNENIEITVEYRLRDNKLEVMVPRNKILETGENLLLDISILPFFGGGFDDDKGYVMIPDGSGALIKFKEDHPVYKTAYECGVFSNNELSVEDDIYSNAKGISLPVFGVNHQEYGFTCDIRDGSANSSIICWPSGYRLKYTNAYAAFHLRRAYYATLSNTSVYRKNSEDSVKHNFLQVYTFLEKGKSTYSDMAASYRSYLLSAGKIPARPKSEAKLGLNIFMATQESQMIGAEYLSATTFSQAQTMLQQLIDADVQKLTVQLTGWGKGGYTAWQNRFPIPQKLGGKSDSKKLAEFMAKQSIPLYYADNYIYADKNKGPVSMKNVVYQANKLLVETNDTENRYLFSPAYAEKTLKNNIKNYAQNQINGISFEEIGKRVYADYNPEYSQVSRQETMQIWQEMLSEWTKAGNRAAVQGGNLYALKYADWITDVPFNDSGYFFSDETVPFYQMVVHGSVLYTGTPINLFSDSKQDYLRMIEYGYMPLFVISHDNPQKLVAADYNLLFSSHFEAYKERIVEEYQRFNSDLSDLSHHAIVKHQQLEKGVFVTAYDNQTKVYVNYNKEMYKNGDVQIGAQDFVVVNTKER